MFKKYVLPTLLISVLVVALSQLSGNALAAPPNGVDHLRGRWDGVVQGLFGEDQPFVLMLDEFAPDPNDALAFLYNGCMAVGVNAGYTPISARVLPLGNENFDLTLFGTAGGAVIKMTGLAFTGDPRVKDDPASGAWQTSDEQGDWYALHHDRREPNCPAVNLGGKLSFRGDVYAAVELDPNGGWQESILEGFSNIVSSGMRVTLPNGSTVDAPLFTDLFSPTVDFIDSFRFLTSFPGLPISNGTYSFALLDVFGQPIPGATSADVWLACLQDAPRNVTAAAGPSGITAA